MRLRTGRDWAQAAGPYLPLLPIALVMAGLLFYPVGDLLGSSFRIRGEWSLANYVRLFSVPVYVQVLWITFKIAGWTTLIVVVGGYVAAYAIATASDRARQSVLFWIVIAFWTSFLVRTLSWIILLGRNGALNQLFQALGIVDAPLSMIYNLAGVLVGMVHTLLPISILTILPVMMGIDANLSRAALTLGARGGTAFWRIYVPLSLPGLAAAALLVFVTALGFFITPALLGGRQQIMITQLVIEQVLDLMNWGFASAISLLLLVSAGLVFVLYDRLVGLSTLAGDTARGRPAVRRSTGARSAFRRAGSLMLDAVCRISDAIGASLERIPGLRAARASRVSLWLFTGALVVFLIFPVLLMIPVSFTARPDITWPPTEGTWRWYVRFLQDPLWVGATTRSLIVGVLSAGLSMLIGVPAAFALVRANLKGRGAILALIVSPLILPRIIIAVALFYLYARINLVGTSLGLVLGHTVVATPYVVITVMAVLRQFDRRLEHAAYTLGAGRAQTLLAITLPIIRPGLVSAFLFAFVTSFDELTIALFVSGGLSATLPKQMWDQAILGMSPTIAAASTLLVIVTAILVYFADRLVNSARART